MSLPRSRGHRKHRSLSLRQCFNDCCQMSEGRKSQIVLLDERRLDIIIQPKLYANELLDLVASHFKLKEKHYFGLGFIDETHHFNWLQGDKRVLDHEFPKKTGHLLLHFSIKFYVETIGMLRDTQTVELFYLNARQALFRGPIECDSETVFNLAAHVLQACNGDFGSEEETREELKKIPLIPTRTLKEHPSISYCEDRVICYYEKLAGTSRGQAIVGYMSIVEKLPTYGIHFYDVKDKKDIPWWLGISPKGIAVYDRDDKNTHRKLFRWSNIENLYCREKKFTIEVHSPKRDDGGSLIVQTLSSFNPYEDAVREASRPCGDDLATAISDPTTQVSVSRRTFGGSNVDVHAWLCVSNSLTRCIWSMAVAQHLFDVECRQKKGQVLVMRSMADLASDLCRSTTSLPGSLGSDLSRSPSSHSLPSLSNSRYDLTIEQSDSLKAEREMYQALKARKEALEEALRKKTEELKRICFEEGELTGELPTDTPLAHGEQPPTFRRRVGTAFSLSVKDSSVDSISSELSKLELEVELQGKITSAAHRLASDKTVSKYVRKQRRQSYIRSMGKLKEMEKKLGDMRRQAGKPAPTHPKGRGKEDPFRSGFPCPSTLTQQGDGDRPGEQAQRLALSPSHSSPQLSSCQANQGPGPHTGGPHHPHPHHPHNSSLASRNSGGDVDAADRTAPGTLPLVSALRLDGSHDSGFSSANNMYNISSQRTSHYESTDQLRSPAISEPGGVLMSSLQQQQQQQSTNAKLDNSSYSRHHQGMFGGVADSSGDHRYRRQGSDGGGTSNSGLHGNRGGNLHYGSLDRKQRSYTNKPDAYRDVSPMRFRGYSSQDEVGGGRGRDPERFQGSIVAPSGVILEVPVEHSSYDQRRSSDNSDHQFQQQQQQQHYHQQHQQQSLGVGSHLRSSHHCYSPSMQEGSPLYHNVDVSHVHRRTPTMMEQQQQQQHGLKSAHHTASQPVFHRIERSMSPSTPSEHHHQQQPSQNIYSHTADRSPHQAFPHHHQSYASSHHGSDDGSHSIPIHHVSSTTPSSYSPSPSSPVTAYPPSTSSPSSGASSPRGPPIVPSNHAPSSLVTVSRFQPHMEVTKPYETSDFYRYSEKLRRQRIIDQYQRQLIGTDRLSRSSTPQSVDSDSHSTHSGSASFHSHPSPGPQSQPHVGYAGIPPPSQPPPSRRPTAAYGRSASAPLSSMGGQQRYPPQQQHQQHPNQSSPYYHQQHTPLPSPPQDSPQNFPDGQMTASSSSSSSYSIHSQGSGVHYSMHSSYKVQQVQSSTKHTLYHPPQPMACRPVKSPPSFNNSDDNKTS